jgi:hypothetical protein
VGAQKHVSGATQNFATEFHAWWRVRSRVLAWQISVGAERHAAAIWVQIAP